MQPDPPEDTAAKAPPVDAALLLRVARWLPFAMAGQLLIGVPAVLISLVVAYGTYIQAGATERIQQAATWPFVAFSSSNYSDTGERRIAFAFTNNGLGPALLGPVEVRYDRRIVRSPQELLAACCGFDNNRSAQLRTRPIANVALRPGQAVEFLSLPDVPANVPMVDELDAVRPRIHVRACYCSIFSECWTVAGEQAKPMAVAACPTNWLSYSER